jgi:polysaccharide export outer membrane protein
MSITQSMKNIFLSYALFFLGGAHTLLAQTPPQDMVQTIANVQAQSIAAQPIAPTREVSPSSPVKGSSDGLNLPSKSVDTMWAEEIKALKMLDRKNKPRQFAADLFEYRQPMSSATDGGISDDYVLGAGDRLQLNVFGSATFETPVQVDGKGDLAIPKVGVVKVAGLTLKKATESVQRIVSGQFSKTNVDLQVIKLREVRISVLGEVYKPGTYLVPSLSSVLNVLGLTGGPNMNGSYRDIRIVRAGKIVDRIDLYPLRGEGLGNLNVALQSGDVVFVPLAVDTVLLEGAFRRVTQIDIGEESKKVDIKQLGSQTSRRVPQIDIGEESKKVDIEQLGSQTSRRVTQIDIGEESKKVDIKQLGSQTSEPEPEWPEPEWWGQWDRNGIVPQMQFELKEGESLSALIQWAGGVDSAYESGVYTRRYQNKEKEWVSETFSPSGLSKVKLEAGDVLTALPKRSLKATSIQLVGHIRIPGPYAPEKNLRIGDLIKKNELLLPTTYLLRGEITRTSSNRVSSLILFDVGKALEGDPNHNLLLEKRDVVRFYSNLEFRIPHKVRIAGPLPGAGVYELLEGMRASDLLIRGGIPYPQANRYRAELSRSKVIPGQSAPGSLVIPLALEGLLSTEQRSSVNLTDDSVNPLLQHEDTISVFEIPNFAYHRSVVLRGQVQRPGEYVLENERVTLSQVIARAGGLTDKAFLEGSVFLRGLSADSGIPVSEIIKRLTEVKRDPLRGVLQESPTRFTDLASKRLVVDFKKALQGDFESDLFLNNGDVVVVPEFSPAAYVVGEVASPFTAFQLGESPEARVRVSEVLERAGGFTRNADTSNIRLLRTNGQVIEGSFFSWWTHWTYMGPGDTILVPTKYAVNTNWVQDLTTLTNLALLYKIIIP